jgi:endonuclease YncB( thermonuclease family)
MSTGGTEWAVDQVVRVTDGDTLRVRRSRPVELDGRTYKLGDNETTGIPIRLVWVDTPERSDVRWGQARKDLTDWILAHQPLRVVCYESAGWDRLLGDLLDADGNSASQWLMIEKGWPPYHG